MSGQPTASQPPASSVSDLALIWGPTVIPSSLVVGLKSLKAPGEESNYLNWEVAFKATIFGAEMGHVLDPVAPKEIPAFYWKRQNDSVSSLLIWSCDDENYAYITPHTGNVHRMWRALRDAHLDSSMAAKILVLRKLISARFEGGDIDLHLSHIETLAAQLKRLTSQSPLTIDDIVVASMSVSIPDDWNSTIHGLLQSPAVSPLAVARALRSEAARRKTRGGSVDALAVSGPAPRTDGQPRPARRQRGNRGRGEPRDRQCSHCGKNGHVVDDCHALGRQLIAASYGRGHQPPLLYSHPPQSNPPHQANVAERLVFGSSVPAMQAPQAFPPNYPSPPGPWVPGRHDSPLFAPTAYSPGGSAFCVELITHESEALSHSSNPSVLSLLPSGSDGLGRLWILDSGCIATSTPLFSPEERAAFPSRPVTANSSVRVANGSVVPISERRAIPLPWSTSGEPTLDFLAVPGLKHSLLSVRQLQAMGFPSHFLVNRVEVRDARGYVVATGVYRNGLAVFRPVGSCLLASVPQDADLRSFYDWHCTLGHVGEAATRSLLRALGVAFRVLSEDFRRVKECRACCKGKLHKRSFRSRSEHRTSVPFAVVHSDVASLSLVSKTGFLYFVSFIDEFSKYTVCYAMKSKSEVASYFLKFINLVKSKFGFDVCSLRSDNGGEYVSSEMVSVANQRGITQVIGAPYTPESNGLAERWNRTACEWMRALFALSGVPVFFWPECLQHVIHNFNACPTKTTAGKVSPLAALGFPASDASLFAPFGCEVYYHLPPTRRSKLGPVSQAAVFLHPVPKGRHVVVYDRERHLLVKALSFRFFTDTYPFVRHPSRGKPDRLVFP